VKRLLIVVFVLITMSLCSCGTPSVENSQIEVVDPWARAFSGVSMESQDGSDSSGGEHSTVMGMNSAAYMVLQNHGNQSDRLMRAESDIAKAVELHFSEMKDGVMSMRPVEFIEVPAGGETVLKQGGLHIMLIGLKHDLTVGDTVS
jgi:copper(I)-binding protein